MRSESFSTFFAVGQTPEEVYAAINNVRGWWTGEIEGSADNLGDEFTYRYEDLHYSKQKISELAAGKKVAWVVTDSNLSFTEKPDEWTGTTITYDISVEGDETVVRFAHEGLVPEFECFSDCSNGWNFYIDGSLRNFIENGKVRSGTLQ
jgi:hypothetical protein